MTVRTSFVEHFGEDTAVAIEKAAEYHKNGIHDRKGSDPFKWAIAICIGFECASREGFRNYHAIQPAWDDIKAWIKNHAHLETHDGDCDFISLVAGTYNEFMPEKEPA